MKQSKLIKAIGISAICAGLLVGCGGGGSSATTTDGGDTTGGTDPQVETPVVTNPYEGSKTLSGSFETFGSTTNEGSRAINYAATGEIVKLYVMGEDGELKDTNLTCDIAAGGTYTCDNIAGNKEYIVRYMKDLGNNQVLEMKSSVAIEDEDVTGATVNRVTTLIVEAVSKAVEEAIVGVELTEEKVTELIAKVKGAIQTSITTLVEDGLIQVPSQEDLIVEESFENIQVTVKENENLADSSSTILTDESVTNRLSAEKGEAKLSGYADMSDKELVREIFAQTGDGEGDIPDWVVEFLGDKYADVPDSYTFETFFSELDFQSDIEDDDEYQIENLERMGISLSDINSLVDIANTQLNSNGFTKLKEEILAHYALKEKEDKTDDDYKKLGEFPPIIEFLFPKEFAESMQESTKLDNMGQGIVTVMFVENVFAKEVVKTYFETEIASGEIYEDQLKHMWLMELDPFFIFEDLGFANELSQYDNLTVNWFEARTDTYWDENGKKEFLSVYTDVEKPSWMFGEDEVVLDESKLTEAILTYPKEDGTTGTVELDYDIWGDMIELRYSPWSNCNGGYCEPDMDKMNITDHVTGEYTVKVTYDGESVEKTFNQFVLKGASDYNVELTFPTQQPQWPEELNNVDWTVIESDPTLMALQEEFNEAWHEYQMNGRTVIGSNENGVAQDVIFRWDDSKLKDQIEDLNLPENIIPAYQVGLNLYQPVDTDGSGEIDWNDCQNDDWQECNVEIYNTWWDNRPIQGNSFKLPVALEETDENGRYNINVNVVFIDKDTGRDVGQGGHTWAEFEVGTGSQLLGSENINFRGTIDNEDLESAGELPTNFNLKVALMKENCTFDATTFNHTCTREYLANGTVTDGNYSLDVNVSTIQEALGGNGYIGLITFNDNLAVSDGGTPNEWDDWNHESQMGEQAWWPNSGLWFDNWGEFIVNVDNWDDESGEHSHQSFKVKQGEDINVTGVNFKLWY
jgi:hypothetical protein